MRGTRVFYAARGHGDSPLLDEPLDYRVLAAVLPRARLVVFAEPGVVFRERARLRAEVAEFLNAG